MGRLEPVHTTVHTSIGTRRKESFPTHLLGDLSWRYPVCSGQTARIAGDPVQGPGVPSVDPVRLQQSWAFMHEHGVAVGQSVREIKLGPKTDQDDWASYRAGMLWILTLDPGDPLAPWRRGVRMADVVFRVAAVFPIEWVGEGLRDDLPFDVDAFLQELRDEDQRCR